MPVRQLPLNRAATKRTSLPALLRNTMWSAPEAAVVQLAYPQPGARRAGPYATSGALARICCWTGTGTYRQAVQRGARGVIEPFRAEDELGSIELSAIATYGDTIHTFVNRSDYAGPFKPGYRSVSTNGQPTVGVGLTNIDHVVGNVELGRMNHWVEFYERVFGMTEMIHFSDDDISTEYSALMSKVMADGEGKIKFPINEPAEGKGTSQIEEYLEFNHGPGAQHIAIQST